VLTEGRKGFRSDRSSANENRLAYGCADVQVPAISDKIRAVRVLVLALATSAVLATSAAAAQIGTAAGVATPNTAGAKPARLKVSLNLELRCARPGLAAIVVSLPKAWRVPKQVARNAVWVDSSHPSALTVSRHTLTVQPVSPTGTCNSIAPGTITVKFTRAAKLGNPHKAGRYTIRASVGTQNFSTRVSITAG
jgi:hypothetical protein